LKSGTNGGGAGGGGGGGYGGGTGGAIGSPGAGGDSYINTTALVSGSTTHAANINAASGVVTIQAVCFAEGTLIQTARGPVAVEHLTPGDLAVTASGTRRPIVWIGHRTIDLTRHPEPMLARPVRVAAGAFPGGLPQRDLLLSPDHAVVWDGALVPVKHLVNGGSIAIDTVCRSVTYYHVELDSHDILMAEGLPAESYLDTGNRGFFANGGQPVVLFPGFVTGQEGRTAQSCLPFAAPAQAETAWRALASYARSLGWTLPRPVTTSDADPHLLLDGRRIGPAAVDGQRYIFVLPEFGGAARLVSRSGYPAEIQPWIADGRRLGVMVRGIAFRDENDVLAVAMDDPALQHGWWAPEREDIQIGRWTNGNAELPCFGKGVLELVLSGTIEYNLENPVRTGERAAA
jgi:hypothetical protein